MSRPRDDRQDDLFRPPLEQIIDLRHPLVRLSREIDWDFVGRRFGAVCRSGRGQPPLPTRLVAGPRALTTPARGTVGRYAMVAELTKSPKGIDVTHRQA